MSELSLVSVECPHCGEKFSKQANLTPHILRVHQGRKFECDICKKKLSSKFRLNQHFLSQHDGKQPSFTLVTEAVIEPPKYTEAEKDAIITEQTSEILRLEQELIRIKGLNTEMRKHLIAKPKNEETKEVRILDRRSYN